MRRLGNAVTPVQVPTGAYVVVKKYVPKRGKDKFFVMLVLGGYEQKAMFPSSLYDLFDPGDSLVFSEPLSISRSGWVGSIPEMEVFRAIVPTTEKEFELGYVSNPRQVGQDHFYLANVGDDGWLRISYQVASEYFAPPRSTNGGDYYAILHAARDATPYEIRSAYRARARECHPDLHQGLIEKMLQVNEAYEVLSDEEARMDYDRFQVTPGAPHQAVEVRVWPGRGFGTLKCLVEHRGDTWLVTEILAFRRNELVREGSVPIGELRFTNSGVSLVLSDLHQEVWLNREDLPFEPLEILNRVKEQLPGEVSFRVVSVQRGWWDHSTKTAQTRWEEREVQVTWSEDFVQGVLRHLGDHRYARHMREAVRAARDAMQRMGVLFNLAAIAKEHFVSPEDLEGAFWRPEYNQAFAQALASEAVDNRWGYSEEYLVFRLPNHRVVLERPVYGAATYIFKQPPTAGPQTIGQLVAAVQATRLTDLRRDKAVQQSLGYVGFAIHREQDSWWNKIVELVYT